VLGDKISEVPTTEPALPSVDLLALQAEWLYPARSRLLRRAAIGHRQRVLDLGAGYGAVTGELARRCGGSVVACDIEPAALSTIARAANIWPAAGDARRLPFPDQCFDLVFCQCTLLWISPLSAVLAEVWRVLRPGGVFIALEPDYGGLIEYPPHQITRDIWQAALPRAGADPWTGRKLPGLLAGQGFDVQVSLLDELSPASIQRLAFLSDLPLTAAEKERLDSLERQPVGDHVVAHLPFFLISASRRKHEP
jgi:SAM-dependent methyltransferase